MKDKKLKNIEKVTSNKFVNLYKLHYSLNNKDFVYELATRRHDDSLALKNKQHVDAVRILPYYKKDDEIFVCLIKEFRFAVNDYLFSLPAGLVDNGEDPKCSAIRELKEEIGAEVITIIESEPNSFVSPGIVDESVICYEALVELTNNTSHDYSEDITLHIINLNEILEFLSNNNVDLQSRLLLKIFYYKTILNNYKKN